MCGINGIIKFKPDNPMELKPLVSAMNEKIVYRGPDSEGIYLGKNVCLGMRRLSIIDLNNGNQPIYNKEKSIVAVFNGEIYNFLELKAVLEKKGHRFRTKTDTEVIIHSYEEYGEDFFDKLDGMFAFALYDKEEKTIFIARDRMGEKPCYYYKDENYFIFGSEMKSLMAVGLVPKKINSMALCQFLQLTYIPAPLSILEGVYKIRPGHYIKITQSGQLMDRQYWNLSFETNKKITSYKQAKKDLFEKCIHSIEKRMKSDVPVGAFLSGGIDSGSIVGIMSQISKKAISTFTIGFCEKEYDERKRAGMVAALNRTKHHEYIMDYKKTAAFMDEIIEKMDEPFADSSMLPTYLVSKLASKHVKVILTGDGADELFGGYSKYLIGYYSNKYMRIPKVFRKRIIEPITEKILDKGKLSEKVRKVIQSAEKDIFTQRKEMMCLGFRENELLYLMKENFYHTESLGFIKEYYYSNTEESELSKALYTDMKTVLEGDMLVKVDRMSMLNSLETRVPFLSRDIIEFSAGLPDRFKINGKRLKCILKDAMKEVLPPKFDKYPKSGFGVPLELWIRDEMKEEFVKVLDKDRIEKQGIFQAAYVQKLLEEHLTGEKNRKNQLWTLFVFQKWFDNYFCREKEQL